MGAIIVVDRANWEMTSLFACFKFSRDFSEGFSKENEIELFILRIIFKL